MRLSCSRWSTSQASGRFNPIIGMFIRILERFLSGSLVHTVWLKIGRKDFPLSENLDRHLNPRMAVYTRATRRGKRFFGTTAQWPSAFGPAIVWVTTRHR